jgi:predicted PurR-regulated permease PerM
VGDTPVTAPAPGWDVTRVLLAVVVLSGLIAASFWLLKPFLPSVIWATTIVVATWPAMRVVQARLWGKRSLAAAIMTLTILGVVVAPLSVASVAIVSHLDDIVRWAQALASLTVPAPPAWVGEVPLIGGRVAEEWSRLAGARPEDFQARVAPYTTGAVLWGIGQLGGIGALLVQFLLTVAVSAILYTQGEAAAAGILAFARRLAGAEGERVVVLSAQAIRAVALGIVVTALVQSVIGGIGLAITGVPYAALLTAVMLLLGVAQIGPLPVLLGGIVWLYWKGDTLWGTVLLLWAVVTATLDNFLRPILIRKGADLPLLLIFAGVIGGLLAFGIVGLFVGPVVLAVTYTLLVAWVAKGGEPPAPAARDQAPIT